MKNTWIFLNNSLYLYKTSEGHFGTTVTENIHIILQKQSFLRPAAHKNHYLFFRTTTATKSAFSDINIIHEIT